MAKPQPGYYLPCLYERQGWRSWVGQRTIVRLAQNRPPGPPPEGEAEAETFDRNRHFAAVKAIHSAYSGSRNGTVIRDDTLWESTFALAGNPVEEFWVARRGGISPGEASPDCAW